jgi:hypothetical protein
VTVQILKLQGERYVLLKEKDYRILKNKAGAAKTPKASPNPPKSTRRLTAQDRADAADALRRQNDPNDREIPYDEIRQRLGLA